MEKIESMQDVYKIARRYKPDETEKCYNYLHSIKNVPDEIAYEFHQKFGKNGELSMLEAVQNLLNYLHKNK